MRSLNLYKARFKRRIYHVSNAMQMSKILCSNSFALHSTHEQFDVWNAPYLTFLLIKLYTYSAQPICTFFVFLGIFSNFPGK